MGFCMCLFICWSVKLENELMFRPNDPACPMELHLGFRYIESNPSYSYLRELFHVNSTSYIYIYIVASDIIAF